MSAIKIKDINGRIRRLEKIEQSIVELAMAVVELRQVSQSLQGELENVRKLSIQSCIGCIAIVDALAARFGSSIKNELELRAKDGMDDYNHALAIHQACLVAADAFCDLSQRCYSMVVGLRSGQRVH